MKNLPLLFLGIFFTLAFSWTGLILTSHLNLGKLQPTSSTLGEDGNPVPGEPQFPVALGGIAVTGREIYMDQGCIYCHSQQVRPKGYGADFDRGWGNRQTVARDYIYQDRVLLGTSRTGPDLSNVGDRLPSREWHLQHLYHPRITSPGSIMPPYSYLFEVRAIVGLGSSRALNIPDSSPFAPADGYEVVPTDRAEALVAYLLSLKLDYELPEIKFIEE
jgi:cytochrome c oxidase cbb3-type subunit II